MSDRSQDRPGPRARRATTMASQWLGPALLLALCAGCLPRGAAEQKQVPRRLFQSSEHWMLGDGLVLPPHIAQGQTTSEATVLRLRTGNSSFLNLTFGEVVFLAGDYFAVPSEPICFAPNGTEAQRRFLEAFETLAGDPKTAGGILEYISGLRRGLERAVEAGNHSYAFYDSLGERLNQDLNRITGGGSSLSPYIPLGTFLKVSEENFDHFSAESCAAKAYAAGHGVAMQVARAQGASLAEKTQAYAYEAFAQHFLSDTFSSGHVRTPRVAMRRLLGSQVLSDLLASYMHDEDSRLGLNVTNRRGDRWVAFGDSCLLDPGSARNKQLVSEAMQMGLDGVEGGAPWAAIDLIPRVDPDPRRPSITPMFSANGTHILRRSDLNAPWDRGVTTYWESAGTLTELKVHYKKPTDMPPQGPSGRAERFLI